MAEPCCALDVDHDGPCAHICPSCFGTGECPECDAESIEDFGGCGCGGGPCPYCFDGLVSEDA